MRTLSIFFTLAFTCLLFTAPVAHAAGRDEATIKQSMIQRVSAIDALKLTKKVGENNRGLLVQRAALTPQETKRMNEENKDRRDLYAILAQRLNVTVTIVGQGRAEDLRKKSASGVWLQDPSGKWYLK